MNYGELKSQLEETIKNNIRKKAEMVQIARNIVNAANVMFFTSNGYELTATNTLEDMADAVTYGKLIQEFKFDYIIVFTTDYGVFEFGVSVGIENDDHQYRFKVDGHEVSDATFLPQINTVVEFMWDGLQQKINKH